MQGIPSNRGLAARQRQQKKASNQSLTSQFPTHQNREFFAALQGIQKGDQGKFRAEQGNRFGFILSTAGTGADVF